MKAVILAGGENSLPWSWTRRSSRCSSPRTKDVDGPVFKVFKDPRVTRVGRSLRKLSLDELPQLWNVLAGDMSLVGPRPLVMEEMRFSPSWRDLRLSIKPGITGPWKIGGRSHCSFHDWILKDVSYMCAPVRSVGIWSS